MKNKKLLYIIAVAMAFSACKSEKVEPAAVNAAASGQAVSVASLTTYLSGTVNVPASSVTYNPATDQFQINGVNQISRAVLTKIYLRPVKKCSPIRPIKVVPFNTQIK